MLATKTVSVELHDCDEFIQNKENEADARFSAGKAKFTFRDFLRPATFELRLRSDVFPLKREEVDNTQNLDLNTTAKKNEKTVERASPYLVNATYSVVIAKMARPIGAFDEAKELAAWRQEKALLAGLQTPSQDTRPISPTTKHDELTQADTTRDLAGT